MAGSKRKGFVAAAPFTKSAIREILRDLEPAPARSCLEPYRDLIAELRGRRYSYRSIAQILASKCGLQISHSTIHDFANGGSNVNRPSSSRLPVSRIVQPPTATGAIEIQERIEALKRRPANTGVEEAGFRFDPSKPLRLKQ